MQKNGSFQQNLKEGNSPYKRSIGVTIFAILLFVNSVFVLYNLKTSMLNDMESAAKMESTLSEFTPSLVSSKFFLYYTYLSDSYPYIFAICALISSIGIFLLKEWARKTIIIVSIGGIAMWLGYLCVGGILFLTNRTDFLQAFSGIHTFSGIMVSILFLLIPAIALFFLSLLVYFFTRPKIKEQFIAISDNIQRGESMDKTKKEYIIPISILVIATIIISSYQIHIKNTYASQSSKTGQKFQSSQAETSNGCKIEGILFSEDNPCAMIGGSIHCINDTVCGVKIIKVSANTITVEYSGKEVNYNIGSTIRQAKHAEQKKKVQGEKESVEVKKEYYLDGKLKSEVSYQNGIEEGVARIYYKSGQLFEEKFFKNAKLDGIGKSYYENGRLSTEFSYKEGLKEWEKFYDDNGELIMELIYRNNQLIERKDYRKSFR